MRFSQRQGLTPHAKLVQKETIDNDLKNSLWSLLNNFYWERYNKDRRSPYGRCDYIQGSNMESLIFALWFHYFKEPTDTIHNYFYDCLDYLRAYYFKAKWFEILDFIEFISDNGLEDSKEPFIKACNNIFERENSAYRFLNGIISEISSDEEIEAVEDAIECGASYPGVKSHLVTALNLLADRKNPDFRNSIKESISAVEAFAKQVTNDEKATLGTVLKRLEDENGLHPALKKSFSALYGYTSDAQGIRHALMGESSLSKADARFMLISCSAFINYIRDIISS